MIPLGYELGTGKRVSIPLGHMIVLGQTQKSGKTTTLEAVTERSGVSAVAFITKRGEKSFRLAHTIPPYYSETSETQPYWKFVVSMIESMQDVKLGFRERGWVMELCRDSAIEKTETNDKGKKKRVSHAWQEPESLREVLSNAELAMEHSKGTNRMICLQLVEYLKIAVPEIERAKLSNTLKLQRGINVMDISKLSASVQALIVRSVVEYVYLHRRKTVVIIPEAWKFLPEGHGTPVSEPARTLIRQGAALENFVWIDLQDLRGIEKQLLRSIQVWLFGVQREKNEVENTIKSMPVPECKPTAAEMMSLRIGQFIVAHGDEIRRVYVQPAGMEDAHAQAIALGDEKPESWSQIVRSLDAEERAPSREEASGDSGPGDGGVDQRTPSNLDDGRSGRGDAIGDPSEDFQTQGSTPIGDEDTMWKEKYEELKTDYDKLVQAHDALALQVTKLLDRNSARVTGPARAETAAEAQSFPNTPITASAAPKNGSSSPGDDLAAINRDLELQASIRYVFSKMASDDPATAAVVAQLAQAYPEIRVTRERRVLQMNASDTHGRIALLLSEGFFDAPRDQGELTKEFKRRGWFEAKTSNAAVIKPMAKLTEWGFFTKEETGYRAVPGMKINVVEVPA